MPLCSKPIRSKQAILCYFTLNMADLARTVNILVCNFFVCCVFTAAELLLRILAWLKNLLLYSLWPRSGYFLQLVLGFPGVAGYFSMPALLRSVGLFSYPFTVFLVHPIRPLRPGCFSVHHAAPSSPSIP